MGSVFHGLRRRLSQPLLVGIFIIAAFAASTSLVAAEDVVIGLPATPPPAEPGDFTAPDDDEPDPPAPTQPDDFTDGDGGDPNPPFPSGPDDFTDADPEPQHPDGEIDVPTDDGVTFDPGADPVEPQTSDAPAPVAMVVALPETGAGDSLDQGHSPLAPLFVLLAAACLLATRWLHAHPGARN